MATITIDGTEYALDALSDDAKTQIGNLRYADEEIARLQATLALVQTARISYARALKAELEKASA